MNGTPKYKKSIYLAFAIIMIVILGLPGCEGGSGPKRGRARKAGKVVK